jgi:hypothetical protein
MSSLKDLPRSTIVFLVLLLGVAALFVLRRPHSLCDSEVDALKENQKGQIFSGKVGSAGIPRPPMYEKALASCRLGSGTAGACFEYFKILHRLTVDLESFSSKCGEVLGETVEVKRALGEGIGMMVELAWGEAPPEKDKVTGWLEAPDLALFCKLKTDWIKFFGNESFEALKIKVLGKLSDRNYQIDAQGNRICTNCETEPLAVDILGREEAFGHSLFAISCRQFL